MKATSPELPRKRICLVLGLAGGILHQHRPVALTRSAHMCHGGMRNGRLPATGGLIHPAFDKVFQSSWPAKGCCIRDAMHDHILASDPLVQKLDGRLELSYFLAVCVLYDIFPGNAVPLLFLELCTDADFGGCQLRPG